MLDDLYDENWETFKALTLYIKAAELALDKAKNEELPALYAKAQETGYPEAGYRINAVHQKMASLGE